MIIGDRLRALREDKKLSQGDIEKRTGLVPPYISRVENNHTVPNIETLEKWARALEVPMYELFYDGEEPPKLLNLPKRKSDEIAWGSSGKDGRFLTKLRRLLGKTNEQDRKIILLMAQKMALRSFRNLSLPEAVVRPNDSRGAHKTYRIASTNGTGKRLRRTIRGEFTERVLDGLPRSNALLIQTMPVPLQRSPPLPCA